MSSYFIYNKARYNLPSDCSFSMGNSCDTREKRSVDGTKTSYSIATFKKAQASTYSLSFVLNNIEYNDLFAELYRYENLVGKSVNFTYCNIPFGIVIITDMSVSLQTDTTLGLIGLSFTFNMRENIVITSKTPKVNVRFK